MKKMNQILRLLPALAALSAFGAKLPSLPDAAVKPALGDNAATGREEQPQPNVRSEDDLRAATAEVKACEKQLRDDLRGSVFASGDKWERARAKLSADYRAYQAALQKEAVASLNSAPAPSADLAGL